MSDRENYNASQEDKEGLRELYRKYCEVASMPPPSEEKIDEVCAIWSGIAKSEKVSAREYFQKEIAFCELEKKINAESETCEERRRRLENELGLPTEESGIMGTLDIAMDDIEWLEAKTGCKVEEVHHLSDEYDKLINFVYQNPGNEEAESALERLGDEVESLFSKTKERLQSVLAFQQKQSVKPPVVAPVKHARLCARTASRAHRGAARPTFTQSGGGGSGGGGDDDDGGSDSSDPDLPEPEARAHHQSSVKSSTKHHKPTYTNRRFFRRSWHVGERRCVA